MYISKLLGFESGDGETAGRYFDAGVHSRIDEKMLISTEHMAPSS